MGSQQKTSLWTGSFVLLILLNLFNGIAGQMTIPLVAKYSLSLTPDLTLASTVSGLMSLVSLFICPFAGLLSDRFDRRKILIYSSAGYGIALIGMLCSQYRLAGCIKVVDRAVLFDMQRDAGSLLNRFYSPGKDGGRTGGYSAGFDSGAGYWSGFWIAGC